MTEVERVSINKFCWKAKTKDWDYMSAINVWDHFQNDFNIKYMANNKQTKTHGKQFTITCHLQVYFRIQRKHSKNP